MIRLKVEWERPGGTLLEEDKRAEVLRGGYGCVS